MAIKRSEVGWILNDGSVVVTTHVWHEESEDLARGHGEYQLRPDQYGFEEACSYFGLKKPGDCIVIESTFRDGEYVEDYRRVIT